MAEGLLPWQAKKLYVDNVRGPFTETLEIVDQPLASLQGEAIRPSREALSKVMSAVFQA